MPARRPQPKGQPNPGVSHGVAVLVGGRPWDAAAVASGLQCRTIHPVPIPEGEPVACCCCGQGNPAADRIAERIDYGPAEADDDEHEAAKFKPRTKAKYRLRK